MTNSQDKTEQLTLSLHFQGQKGLSQLKGVKLMSRQKKDVNNQTGVGKTEIHYFKEHRLILLELTLKKSLSTENEICKW